MSSTPRTDDPVHRHGPLADAQGLAFGTTMTALGITMLTHLGLATGQTAGLAVLLAYVTGQSFGLVFFVVNLPFYWFGYRRMGLRFTLKTFAAVALLSGLSAVLPQLVQFDQLHPVVGAVLFGMCAGAGLLALFRHGASLGGVGILALYLQDRLGFRAGYTQLIFDACVFVFAAFVLPWDRLALSVLGAVVLNLVITINHRRDWYVAS
ncbi:YitT family protein [Pseudooceanicola aestuarii]|uniref:YitT family protein n=1 Tax=Pseudooceanicola aestuarii TaxID=2697319 RepID=UPI001EF99F98|nr:YitT family protein [Pseudooceanicola aestuarii]